VPLDLSPDLSVAQLDRFIQAIQQHRAQGLLLAPGKQASLLIEGAPKPVTRDPLSAGQVMALVREIAGPGDVARLDGPTPSVFTYEGPIGPVSVEVVPEADGARVLIRPTVPTPPGQPAPSAPAAPSARVSGRQSMQTGSGSRAFMDQLLRTTVEAGASDLHLRTGEQPILRRDGELLRQEGQVLEGEALEQMLTSIMSSQDQTTYGETGDIDWAYELPGLARFRCNAARERRGPMGVFRVVSPRLLTVEELGLSPEIQKLCYLTKGLVLVTGPTGCGKSTTLAALVDLINRTRTDHILTIEDPIEFVHTPKKCVVTQREVGEHSRSFKTALRAALREDPDIILVGEMRDLETVSIAIETAETGHLVFGTLHTTTAASTIDRIIDQFPVDRQAQVRVMLAESLKGVVAQVLCRRIGGGRVAAKEVLLSIPAVSNLIREGKTFQIPSIMQTNRKAGMVTLNDALLELVEQKLVEPKEAYMKSVEKTAFMTSLKAKRFDTSFIGEA
jgi:twitching motility protein PilT